MVSQKPEYLKRAGAWIARLDKSDTAGVNLKVYPLRYGNAKAGHGAAQRHADRPRAGGGTLDNASSQIAPGGGLSVSSSEATRSPR